MKPASIISLIISVLLIIIGLVVCMTAQNMAKSNGEYLFAEEVDGDYKQTVELSDTEITKIELIADDCTINIIGGSDRSCIEFVNFRENYYSLSTSNRILSFDEIPDVMSMLKFWENGFSFKGMRYILNFKQKVDDEREKVINVYLDEKEIKIFDIKSAKCTVNIQSMMTETDYNLDVDDLILNVKNVNTSSALNIGSEKKSAVSAEVNITALGVNSLAVYADTLRFNAAVLRTTGSVNINGKEGFVTMTGLPKIKDSDYSFDLRSTSGNITIEGESVHSPYTTTVTEQKGIYTVVTESADISLSRSATSTDTGDFNTEDEGE